MNKYMLLTLIIQIRCARVLLLTTAFHSCSNVDTFYFLFFMTTMTNDCSIGCSGGPPGPSKPSLLA